MKTQTLLGTAMLGGSIAALGCGGEGVDPSGTGEQSSGLTAAACAHGVEETRFFAPAPRLEALQQIAALRKARDFRSAFQVAALVSTPSAAWFTGGSPEEVEDAVRQTMTAAAREHRVPVLVAYNVPFRDCAQYSAGGAVDTASYQAWIDGFARGIGDGRAVVVLEPDALGIIPYNTTLDGGAEWCRPTITDDQGNSVPAPGASPVERYSQLNYAVDGLAKQAPKASVYLDAGHTAWNSVGEAAYRLVQAGVMRTRGFFLNVSNYQPTPQLDQYGTWIAKCIYYANNDAEGGWRLGHYGYCASQYYPASPNDYSTWALTDQWYADNVDNAANPPADPSLLAHFVVDTSRNGQGPFNAASYALAPYNQPASAVAGLNAGSWCNPPGAGAGLRPTADTGVPLADAYLWVKRPGESDGSCDIAGGARAWDYNAYNPWGLSGDAENHFDPLRSMIDPASGDWFPSQALELAESAVPPLGK
jgi:endoglucanase